MARTRKRRKPISEINVVPYIDVMLVLLIIFMITAPLITQGVKVDLPQAAAEPQSDNQQQPLLITVNRAGDMFLNLGPQQDQPLAAEILRARVETVLRHQPATAVMVRGDAAVDYGAVVQAMVLAQAAGAASVGLLTESPQPRSP
jgi:biopolymer transport protein TolR